jgi:predicted nucleotidyltransferase
VSRQEKREVRLRERQGLLDHAARLLSEDEHIAAVWLIGSLGRGDADQWSDIDLWIVVEDDAVDRVTSARSDFAASLGRLILQQDAPQNAPMGGTFLTAMYSGTDGAHLVDIYWQPLSLARRSADTKLLFERASIPLTEPQPDLEDEERIERAIQQTSYFWVMAAIVAKAIARRKAWKVLQLLTLTWFGLEQVRWLVGERSAPPSYPDHPDDDPPVTTSQQLAVLQVMQNDMLELMKRTPALGDAVTSQVVEQVCKLCALVEHELG